MMKQDSDRILLILLILSIPSPRRRVAYANLFFRYAPIAGASGFTSGPK
jgi:hypothetical protein